MVPPENRRVRTPNGALLGQRGTSVRDISGYSRVFVSGASDLGVGGSVERGFRWLETRNWGRSTPTGRAAGGGVARGIHPTQ